MKKYFPYTLTPLYPIALSSAFWLIIANSIDNLSAFSQNLTPSPPANRGEKFACSEKQLETITTQLLRDLPSYANRASQRGRRLRRSSDVYSYMVLAGRPEFQPLPLNPAGIGTDEQKSAAAKVDQVFFTTLARQYIDGKAIELEEFHWVFLTKTRLGWRLVLMFSQTGGYPKLQPPTPPRDSSNGTVAQGIKAWLRDCQAGSVRIRTRVKV
jgi:hypothetical protein